MKIKILGCDGGSLPNFSSVSFLINDHLILDAGSITSKLPLKDQLKIKHVLITHSHLDHIKDLAYLVDNCFLAGRSTSLEVISAEAILIDIHMHIFNGIIWPDMTRIPSAQKPALKLRAINEKIKLENLNVEAVPVAHSHTANGYVISDAKSSIMVSGDTGPMIDFWIKANSLPNLKAIFLEVSFPGSLEDLAYKSRHLTPVTLSKEIKKFHAKNVPIYLYHLKPPYTEKIRSEIKSLKQKNLKILKANQTFRFK